MICRRLSFLILCFLFQAAPGTAQSAGPEGRRPAIPAVAGDSVVAFMSDTQTPIWVETFGVRSNRNEEARDSVFRDILALHPDAIVHLGDIISVGSYEAPWEPFDAFMKQLRREQIPLFPALGNHELMLSSRHGLDRFLDRFPWYVGTGYLVRIGKVAILLLNSNFGALSEAEHGFQLRWADSTLQRLDADSSVAAVIIGCHHPPFTNSTIVRPSEDVREFFVPRYLRWSKCRLFLSGHSHAFEHFRYKGKDFLVVGGGGGLQHPLLTGAESRWDDLFPQKSERRMFHYLKCRIGRDDLDCTVRMLKSDFSSFEDACRFSIPLIPAE